MYTVDSDGILPPCWTRNSSDTWFHSPWNVGALAEYYPESPHSKLLICPSGNEDGAVMLNGRSPRDYGMNGFRWSQTGNINAGLAWSLANSSGAVRGKPVRVTMITDSVNLIYFADKKREIYGQQSTSGAAINGKSDTGPGNTVYNRHFQGNNFVFADGHASFMTQAQYFTDSVWTLDPLD